MRWLPRSLRGRLLVGLITVFLVADVGLMLSGYLAARHEVDELFDAELAHYARVLDGLVASMDDEAAEELRWLLKERGWDPAAHPGVHAASQTGHAYESKLAFQVWSPSGKLIAGSRSAPPEPLAEKRAGYATTAVSGVQWRTFTLINPDQGRVIQAGQQMSIRQELERSIALRSMDEVLYAVPLFGVLVWITVGFGLRPLSRLTQLIGKRDYDNLRPLEVLEREPRELRPITLALDALFLRLANSRFRERRFIDEAAHELRTPLAALQLHAENALSATDDAERRRCLEELLAATGRASHLATQLLTLARLESETGLPASGPVSLYSVVEEELVLLAPLARARGQKISVTIPEGLPEVHGNADLLAIAVRNLLDNAIRYSPRGGTVRITACQEDGRTVLVISDEGPGIDPHARGRVWERFARLDNYGENGSGLGLAIVARIVDGHRAEIELGEGPGGRGLSVAIRFAEGPEKRA